MKKNIVALVLTFLLIGCAQSSESYIGVKSVKETSCNESSFYALGMNNGRRGKDMKESPAEHCDASSKNALVESYHKGYKEGLKNMLAKAHQKGFKEGLKNIPKVKSGPTMPQAPGVYPPYYPPYYPQPQQTRPWICKKAYGKQECGYECIEAYGKIKCAKHVSHNCIEAYGEIRCGFNCRKEYGDIKCDG